MGTFGGYTGNRHIPEEKRDEFARQVIKILNYGGMMQLEKISMYGHDMSLLKPVELYPGGKVNFHFNYFEDDGWESAEFDANRGSFYSGKIGGSEFCEVVTAVYFLYEAWDEEWGFAAIDEDIINDCYYTGWINHLLGTQFSMKKRFRIWDNVEKYALERVGHYKDMTLGDVLQFIPIGMRYGAGGVEFSDLMYIIHGTESLTDDEIEPDTYPADVYGCKKALEVFLEKNQNEDAVNRIWELVRKNRQEREAIKDTELSDIGRFSLILPARVIVYLTAELKEESFWECWKEMHETVYHDEIMKEYASQQLIAERRKLVEEPISPVRTSEFLGQNSDDDRLYWWDGTDEVILSEEMDEWLKSLALSHKEISQNMAGEPENTDEFLKDFLMLLVEIDQYYKRIFPFQNMYYEFLQNGSKTEYRAAVKLLKKLSDENREEGKIIEIAERDWDLTSRRVTHNVGRLRLKRYLSVMANRKLREKYFGF